MQVTSLDLMGGIWNLMNGKSSHLHRHLPKAQKQAKKEAVTDQRQDQKTETVPGKCNCWTVCGRLHIRQVEQVG